MRGNDQIPATRARRHTLHWDGPTPRFLHGALLGNGGFGVVVTTRPDAIVLRLGHNDIWDRRIDESHRDGILTFSEMLHHIESLDPDKGAVENDEWFEDYRSRMVAPYARPYPRPLACGSLILGFNRRRTEVIGHELDILTGVCTVRMRHDGHDVAVEIFVDQECDDLHLTTNGASPFDRVRLLPDEDGPAVDADSDDGASTFILPKPGEIPIRRGIIEHPVRDGIAFEELMPSLDNGYSSPLGSFTVALSTDAPFVERRRADWYGSHRGNAHLERALDPSAEFTASIRLRYQYGGDGPQLDQDPLSLGLARERSLQNWEAYWDASRIMLADDYLERVWYRNTYFAHCALRAGRRAPGLFGSWLHRQTGAAWHGDYHMNYNAQQLYWGTFSSNRVDQHLPYVDLLDHISPVAKSWAADYYGMRGAAYPHSAYNTEMTVNPYPNPVWAWELSESPWSVQSLWWHYQYTQDVDFLRERAMPLMTDVVMFVVDYLLRPDNGTERWGDEVVHIYPTVPPELYGLAPGLRLNRDCLIDIALIRFLFDAWLQAAEILGVGDDDLRRNATDILQRLPRYPTAPAEDGPVFVSVPGEDPDVVYNVPIPGMTVFPGEQHSWEDDVATLATVRRSIRRQLVEGGNDLVFAALQEVRTDLLDVDRFRRQLQYCELPNGTFTDMVLQVHGRYNDATAFEFMESKGIWTENFALPVVVNEMMLQGYSGTLRFFPACAGLEMAAFDTLRAPGAFLVSGRWAAGTPTWIQIESEAGSRVRFVVPWASGARLDVDGATRHLPTGIVELDTTPGQVLVLTPTDTEQHA